MSIAFDTSLAFLDATGTSAHRTFSYTCGSSSLGGTALFIVFQGQNNSYTPSITYNGVAMTFLTSLDNGGGYPIYVFYLNNASVGANTVDVNPGGVQAVRCCCSSYLNGVLSGIDASSTKTGNAAIGVFGNTITTVANNCWVVSSIGASTGIGAGSTGLTSRATSASVLAIGDSNGAVGIGSYTATWSVSTGAGCELIHASIAPYVATSQSATFTESQATSDVGNKSLQPVAFSETQGTSDSESLKFGWKNMSKNGTSWINRRKS